MQLDSKGCLISEVTMWLAIERDAVILVSGGLIAEWLTSESTKEDIEALQRNSVTRSIDASSADRLVVATRLVAAEASKITVTASTTEDVKFVAADASLLYFYLYKY